MRSNHTFVDDLLTPEILAADYQELSSLKAVARKYKLDPSSVKKRMILGNQNLPSLLKQCSNRWRDSTLSRVKHISIHSQNGSSSTRW